MKINQVFVHEEMRELKKFINSAGLMLEKSSPFNININMVIENIKLLDEDFLYQLNI